MGINPTQSQQMGNCFCVSANSQANLAQTNMSQVGFPAVNNNATAAQNTAMAQNGINMADPSSMISNSTLMLMANISSMMLQVTTMVNQTLMMLLQSQQSGSSTNTSGTSANTEINGQSDSATNNSGSNDSTETVALATSLENNTTDTSGFSQDWSDKLQHIPEKDRQAFLSRVLKIAGNLKMDPDYLMAIFMSESGMNPKAVNPGSGATGLIQFMPSTAKGLGTTTSTLKNMSALEQLDYVEKYLSPYKGKMNTKADAYMAVFSPAFIGKGDAHVAYSRGEGGYNGNKGLDANKDGNITNGELAVRLDKFLA